MKGDFSRFTFDPRKRYTGVRLQQGRVQLDADWNEQLDIAGHLRRILARDLIGSGGAPSTGGGFDITAGSDDQNPLLISPGRYWVDGLLCENEAASPVSVNQQPDLPGVIVPGRPNTTDWTAGWYMAYLDVWERQVTALEDSDLLELALGGPDTATRTRIVWQVRLIRVGDESAPLFNCGDVTFPPASLRPARLTLVARTLRLPDENQLYRVEVHTPGGLGTATFKWSRDNGSVAALIQPPGSDASNTNKLVIIRQVQPDQGGGFAADQWIEVTDEARLLQGVPGVLVQLATVSGQELTVVSWPAGSSFSGTPLIRRWDSSTDGGEPVVRPAANDHFIALEEGLEVRFGNAAGATLRTGDYWTIPVRAAAGVLWPQAGGGPAEKAPDGIEHHYAPLALLSFNSSGWRLSSGSSCRKTFQPSVSGIGQEKLNRRDDDTMFASLTIDGNLSVHREVTVGRAGDPDGKLSLLDAPLVPAAGNRTDRGIQFPALPTRSGDHTGFVRYYGDQISPSSPQVSSPRLLLGVEGQLAAIVLRTDATDALTVAGGNVGIGVARGLQKLHVEGGALFRSGTGVVIESSLTVKDGSQGAGRYLVSDVNGRATWKETPLNVGAPVFLPQKLFVGNGGGPTGWIRYALPGDKVPAGIRAVILEAEVVKNSPDSGAVDAQIVIRRGPDDPSLILTRARAAGDGDDNAWGNQGLFPVKTDNSFEYIITGSGFSGGWVLHAVGYFP
jgi:hypothetical protein